jgi:hypothetical protein
VRNCVLAVLAKKSVKQHFDPDERILQLMELFRRMTNDCIRIGLAEGRPRLGPCLVCYAKQKTYGILSAYRLCAISKASGILKSYQRLSKRHHVREPFCSRPSLTCCYGVRINAGRLRMPGNLENSLNTHVQRWLSQPGIEVRSVNLATESISISVRKSVEQIECTGMLGIDRNLDNITVADTENRVGRHDLSKATVIKSQCRQIKWSFCRNDARAAKRVFKKYGRLERDRVSWLLHNVSANIVLQARLGNKP